MKGQMFRLAHLGYFDILDMFSVIAGLELILRANGYDVALGEWRRGGAAGLRRGTIGTEASGGIGILVCGDNHFIVRGREPDFEAALAIWRGAGR